MPDAEASILYPDFLTNETDYAESTRFWLRLWESVSVPEKSQHAWRLDWISTGGAQIRDGNPIFSAVSTSHLKGIRVIQKAPDAGLPELSVWEDTVGGDVTDPDTIEELVISCVLTARAGETAKRLMSSWIRGRIVVEFHRPPEEFSYFSDAPMLVIEPAVTRDVA